MKPDFRLPEGVAFEACAGAPGQAPDFVQLKNPYAPSARIFDLASLTKILSTSCLLADDWLESGLRWDLYLRRKLVMFVPMLWNTPLEDMTLGEAWEHRSGLPAHVLLFGDDRVANAGISRAEQERRALTRLLLETRRTRDCVYSDLGFVLLCFYLERKKQAPLATQFEAWKQRRSLNRPTLRYGVVDPSTAVPTENRHGRGEVNDDNTFGLGGVSSHAGLFGTLDDVWAWLAAVQAWRQGDKKLAPWFEAQGDGRFHGGWDRPGDPQTTHAGSGAPSGTLGHLGYTGTALWWAPGENGEAGQAGVLLTNRVYPVATDFSKIWMRELRREFFGRLWQGTLKGWQAQL